MSNHKPQDGVLSWALPLLPAAIAFALLCVLLASSERMLADELLRHARAQVEQSSRLFAEQLSRSLARRDSAPAPQPAQVHAGAAASERVPLHAADLEDLRLQLQNLESGPSQLRLALVDAQGRPQLGTLPAIDERAWHALQAAPEAMAQRVTDAGGEPYVVTRFAVSTDDASDTPWQVVGAQPLRVALATLHPFRRNLLIWGGGITLLLMFAGAAMAFHVARYQREHRQHLREQGELLSAAIDSAADAIVSVDTTGRVTRFNPAAARIFGHTANSILGQPLSTLLPQVPHLDLLKHGPPAAHPTGAGRVAGARADGQALDLEVSVSHMTVHGARIVTAILRDVTERVRTERTLAQHQLALSELTHRLLEQEKQTTHRLAQTLHDQLGQTVGAIRLSFDVLLNLVPTPFSTRLSDRSRVLAHLIDTASSQVRQALVALRPPLLDEDGLQAALQHEVDARAVDAEPVVLQLEVAPEAASVRWPADVEHAGFMVAREALANALLHANPRTVVLRVDGRPGRLHLSVTDDGVGLNPDMAAGRPGHLGIVGMRERSLAIGAHLRAQALPEGGSAVTLHWDASQPLVSSKRHTQDFDCATPPNHE